VTLKQNTEIKNDGKSEQESTNAALGMVDTGADHGRPGSW
jgi:hypothetical protein